MAAVGFVGLGTMGLRMARRLVAAGHSSSRVWWGNTQSFKQCDGDYAASDGWTVFVSLHQVNH